MKSKWKSNEKIQTRIQIVFYLLKPSVNIDSDEKQEFEWRSFCHCYLFKKQFAEISVKKNV